MHQDHVLIPQASVLTLPPISPPTLVRFHESLPSLLALVHETLRIDCEVAKPSLSSSQRDFIQDVQRYFGETLAAVFEFGLYEILVEELTEIGQTLLSRGLPSNVLSQMVKAWIIALYANLRTPEVKELIPLLAWLEGHLTEDFISHMSNEPHLELEQREFMQALIENRREQALNIARIFVQHHPLAATLDHLFLASMVAIGWRWSRNQITVAEEHLATANLTWVAYRFFGEIKPTIQRAAMVAVVCVPGDVHALGAELLAQYLEYQGWDVLFLGASMPEEDMLRLLEQQQPEALVISIRMIAFLPALRGLVQRVRERLPDMQIMAGGLPRAATVLNTICDGVPADFEACHHLLERRQRHA